MNPRFAATMELQRPAYQDPTFLIGRDVCSKCKRLTTVHRILCDGHVVETHHCPAHGPVAPMRSHVAHE